MDEDLPESAPEVSVEEMRRAIMETMGWNEAELAEQMEEARDQALCNIREPAPDDTVVDESALSAEEIEEAILSFLYQQYVVELTDKDRRDLIM